jgi:hypothetical protein
MKKGLYLFAVGERAQEWTKAKSIIEVLRSNARNGAASFFFFFLVLILKRDAVC